MPDRPTFERWFTEYGRVWEQQDPDGAAALFSEDVKYFESPFDLVASDRDGVRGYWREAGGTQRDVRFSFELLAITGDTGIAHWGADYTRLPSGPDRRLDGIMIITLDKDGLCRELREWWHRQELTRD